MVPNFASYAEAQEWIAEGQTKYGKKAFTARPEYHAAYPVIAALAKACGAKRTKRDKIVRNSLFSFSLNNG